MHQNFRLLLPLFLPPFPSGERTSMETHKPGRWNEDQTQVIMISADDPDVLELKGQQESGRGVFVLTIV